MILVYPKYDVPLTRGNLTTYYDIPSVEAPDIHCPFCNNALVFSIDENVEISQNSKQYYNDEYKMGCDYCSYYFWGRGKGTYDETYHDPIELYKYVRSVIERKIK